MMVCPHNSTDTPLGQSCGFVLYHYSSICIQDQVLLLPSIHLGILEGFNLKLIPELNSSSKCSMGEWLDKLELVCKLRKKSDMLGVIPLLLTGRAFANYQHLAELDKESTLKVKAVIKLHFCMRILEQW